jgi:hypothetical protein
MGDRNFPRNVDDNLPEYALLIPEDVSLRQNGFENPKPRNLQRFQTVSPFFRRLRYG